MSQYNPLKNRVAIVATLASGATFLEWSIHWLTGQTRYYNFNSGWIDLSNSPLTNINAHGHEKNHPCGHNETLEMMEKFQTFNTDTLLSFYALPIVQREVVQKLNISNDDIYKHYLGEILDYKEQDLRDLWNSLYDYNYKTIYVKLNDPIYTCKIRTLDFHITDANSKYNSVTEAQNDFLNVYFKNSKTVWENDLQMTNIWDYREFISLNIRPYEITNPETLVDFTKPYYYLDSHELYYNGEETLLTILEYLDLDLVTTRLDSWRDIYKNWQKIQFDILKFSWNLDHICNAIVNNQYYDISKLNLDIWQEAIIQHIMIYKHGLNFKTWGLEKFPNNTQDLHKLLEPNIYHQVDDIYNVLK